MIFALSLGSRLRNYSQLNQLGEHPYLEGRMENPISSPMHFSDDDDVISPRSFASPMTDHIDSPMTRDLIKYPMSIERIKSPRFNIEQNSRSWPQKSSALDNLLASPKLKNSAVSVSSDTNVVFRSSTPVNKSPALHDQAINLTVTTAMSPSPDNKTPTSSRKTRRKKMQPRRAKTSTVTKKLTWYPPKTSTRSNQSEQASLATPTASKNIFQDANLYSDLLDKYNVDENSYLKTEKSHKQETIRLTSPSSKEAFPLSSQSFPLLSNVFNQSAAVTTISSYENNVLLSLDRPVTSIVSNKKEEQLDEKRTKEKYSSSFSPCTMSPSITAVTNITSLPSIEIPLKKNNALSKLEESQSKHVMNTQASEELDGLYTESLEVVNRPIGSSFQFLSSNQSGTNCMGGKKEPYMLSDGRTYGMEVVQPT